VDWNDILNKPTGLGVTFYKNNTASQTYNTIGVHTLPDVSCDSGDQVTGGGVKWAGGAGAQDFWIVTSEPISTTAWRIKIQKTTEASHMLQAVAMCADLTP
jgi:hypothetical protein